MDLTEVCVGRSTRIRWRRTGRCARADRRPERGAAGSARSPVCWPPSRPWPPPSSRRCSCARRRRRSSRSAAAVIDAHADLAAGVGGPPVRHQRQAGPGRVDPRACCCCCRSSPARWPYAAARSASPVSRSSGWWVRSPPPPGRTPSRWTRSRRWSARVVGAIALILLLRPLAEPARSVADRRAAPPAAGDGLLDRGAVSLLAGRRRPVHERRQGRAWRPPAPRCGCRRRRRPRRPLPGGSELKIPGLSPFTTPTEDFYRIDTALIVPQVSTDGWRLRVHGMVDREVELDFAAAAGPADGRARHHAHLRLERGRREPRGQRPLARRAAGRPARARSASTRAPT